MSFTFSRPTETSTLIFVLQLHWQIVQVNKSPPSMLHTAQTEALSPLAPEVNLPRY